MKCIDFFPEGSMEEVSLDGVDWVSLPYKPQVIQSRKNSCGTQSPQEEVIKLNRLWLPNEDLESARNDEFS